MGETLENMVKGLIAREGAKAYDLLAKKTGKSSMTIRRWVNHGVSDSHRAFLLAKALGCTDEEAIRLANEPRNSAKETA